VSLLLSMISRGVGLSCGRLWVDGGFLVVLIMLWWLSVLLLVVSRFG